MKTTLLVSLLLCAIEFLTIVTASPMAKPSIILSFLPEDVREKAKDHEEPLLYKQMIAHILLGIMVLCFLGGIFYLGIDGMKKGYGLWRLAGRFLLSLYLLKIFDILVQDQWLVLTYGFYKKLYPETKDCEGWKDRSFNKKNQLKRIVAYPLLSLFLAFLFQLFYKR